MINLLVVLLSIIGALAVIAFVIFLIIGLTRGWKHRLARTSLIAAAGLGIVCAIFGVLIAFAGS